MDPYLPYLARRLQHVVKEELENRLAPFGISVRQYTALSILGSRTGLSNAQLARRCLVSPQSMSEVVASLERDGLVGRAPHPLHGRVLQTDLTDKGRAVLADCDAATLELQDLMLSELDADQRASLISGVKSCLRTLGAGVG
jgi:DNA-binding MarR family transcriptional regulator